jgi:hypothetical protein
MFLSVIELSQTGAVGTPRRGPTTVPLLGILLGCLCFGLVALMPAARAEVLGSDDRKALSEQPLDRLLGTTIGQLSNSKTRALCTAFCVRSDVIATAAHCLFGPNANVSESEFELNGSSTKIAGHATPVAHVISGTMSFALSPPINATSDWALAKLANPVCTAGGLALSTATPSDLVTVTKDQPLFQAGFHTDTDDADRMMISTPCRVPEKFVRVSRSVIDQDFAGAEALILHTCDTGSGSSGSPMMIMGAHGVEVVGVNVGTYVRERPSIARKILPTRYRRDTIANTGVSVTRFAERLRELDHLDVIEQPKTLRELQTLLTDEGWFSGPRDSRWSVELRTAIERFERIEGRPIRGIPDTATLGLLRARRTERALETGSVLHHLRRGTNRR